MAEAIEDLIGYVESGNLPLFLKKLLRLEEVGKDVGTPLGRDLTGLRKIVVGDRTWRIIFATDATASVATIWVIGDRDDAECYREAQRRIAEHGNAQPQTSSLAAVMFRLGQLSKTTKKRRDR